ncbi:MAG: histidine kinase, partial [Myroides sp.]
MSNANFFSLCFLMLFYFSGIAQQEPKNKSSKESKVGSLKKIEKAIKDDNPLETAAQYTNLGNQYSASKQYTLSNSYYQRALNIYKDLKDNDKQAEILRKIAINNEALNNIPLATSYFSQAQDKATNVQERQLNSNDLSRVRNNSNASKQADLLNDNIRILEESNKKEEVAKTYQQRAKLSLANKDTLAAISDLKKVAKTSTNDDVKKDAATKLAFIYASTDSLKTAIKILEESSEKAYNIKDWDNYFDLQQKLSDYYFKENNTEKALQSLEASLQKAYEFSNTKWVSTFNNKLYNYYLQTGNTVKANEYAQIFMQRAWNLVNNDSLLMQNKLFNEISQRISLLEKEKETQTVLYNKSKKFNTVLLILLSVLFLAVMAIFFTLKRLKKKNLQVQLQSLRREMNPHFVFNSLNSVNQFIASNDEIAANNYLTKYATLMRNVMNASNKDFV